MSRLFVHAFTQFVKLSQQTAPSPPLVILRPDEASGLRMTREPRMSIVSDIRHSALLQFAVNWVNARFCVNAEHPPNPLRNSVVTGNDFRIMPARRNLPAKELRVES